MANLLNHDALKTRQREIRDSLPLNLGLRVHRALSWLKRAEAETEDADAQFIFLCIAFNAAYAEETEGGMTFGERSRFDDFFAKMIALDTDKAIYNAIWTTFSQSIRVLLDNPYIFQPFWSFQNGVEGYENWEETFEKSRTRVVSALKSGDTKTVLCILFDRLYVLRNQLVHGGATWQSQVNRAQVGDGARILGLLVPTFISLMMENPNEPWGAPFFPVAE